MSTHRIWPSGRRSVRRQCCVFIVSLVSLLPALEARGQSSEDSSSTAGEVDRSWEVGPAPLTPDARWDVDPTTRSNDRTWDAVEESPSVTPDLWEVAPSVSEGWEDEAPSVSEGWENDPPSEPRHPEEAGTSVDDWALDDTQTRGDGGALSVTTAYLQPQRLSLRLSVAGYRETVGLSVAWTSPELFELELGAFADLFARWKMVTPAEEEGGEPNVAHARGQGYGAYGRASIAYPVLNQRGLSERPWTLKVIAGLEGRTLFVNRSTAVFVAIAAGFDAIRWRNPQMGWILGTTVTLPMWELVSGQALSLRPVLRVYVGVAF